MMAARQHRELWHNGVVSNSFKAKAVRASNAGWNVARIVAGLLFVAAGAFKFVVPFTPALAALGVPLPALFGVLVPLVEVLGGLSLILRRRVPVRVARFATALLALDMLTAITLVGVPGALGHPLRVGGIFIGDEAWRLPLEILLLAVAQREALRSVQ